MFYSVYFAKSLKNGKIYTGFTSKDPEIRVQEHNSGSNSWSKQNKPLKLVYYEKYNCEQDARDREKFYKTGIGKAIKNLIVNNIDIILGP
ncbi:MAG: Excinuclease ABC subunit C [Candidatus Gottesmanbacteria bacterium GW2011_GWA1_43_11]|uniref:Excinuclease ABC subunit C n=1 Tax=Candidatus Gottesmanbacteria bacterium GW2011_GWA1_43_11 TaxID=1618436 RepID=A0A0G1CBM8_9BACT|nr:MAG: Excinuclease ABC subunit C [Candidatus Gottesmanbacteria bacterium GW2011_GWA1_43_11]